MSEDKKFDSKDKIDVGFVFIFYHVIVGKMGEKIVYRKCEKEFLSNNKFHFYLKKKVCRRKTIPKETKNLKDQESMITNDLKISLFTETSDSGDLELIEFKIFFFSFNGMIFRF